MAITITYLGESYECERAVKGTDYIHLYDSNDAELASFDGVSSFDGFTISGGDYEDGTDHSDCEIASLDCEGKTFRSGKCIGDIATSNNPVFTGSVSHNRKANTTVGTNSHAEGYDTTASGTAAHSDGFDTTASGNYSYADGIYTTASGNFAHAEGDSTVASGDGSHAKGAHTIAASDYQSVQGKYNVEDANDTYAHIIGGGTADNDRRNIHTLDWSGNAVFAGDVTTGNGTSLETFAAQKGSANGLAELDANGMVPSSQLPSYVDDVLEYATKSAFPATGEGGKIYVDRSTNLTYRWSGSAYTEISPSLALGETASTAYRGDRGKTAYDHSQMTSGNPHGVTKDDVGLGNVPNVSTNNQAPTYTAASSNTALTSGEVLSTAFGKIAKAISSLISHLADTTLHITQTERANWNAKASTSAATTSANGLMTATMVTKLNGIATGATANTVENVLTSTSTTNALSANQGKVLKASVDSINETLIDNACINLLENTCINGTVNGITYTVNEDKSITVVGTSTARSTIFAGYITLDAGTYILSVGTATSDPGLTAFLQTGSTYVDIGESTTGAKQFTVSTTTIYSFALDVRGVSTTVNSTIYPMIRRANISDSTYKQYCKSNKTLTEDVDSINSDLSKFQVVTAKLSGNIYNNSTGTFNAEQYANTDESLFTVNGNYLTVNQDGYYMVSAQIEVLNAITGNLIAFSVAKSSNGANIPLSTAVRTNGGTSETFNISPKLENLSAGDTIGCVVTESGSSGSAGNIYAPYSYVTIQRVG